MILHEAYLQKMTNCLYTLKGVRCVMKFNFDHVMIRVRDLELSLSFYRDILGMNVVRRGDYPNGRFTNVFLSFHESENDGPCVELTYNWDNCNKYEPGNKFGHLALTTKSLNDAIEYFEGQGVKINTYPKIMSGGKRVISFILDPDENLIEVVEPIMEG